MSEPTATSSSSPPEEEWVDLYDPEGHEMIDEIVAAIRDGLELDCVSYTGAYRGPHMRDGGMRVAVREFGSGWTWLLDRGLSPPDCDRICDAIDANEAVCPSMHAGVIQEQCVVATLATLLHLRGIRLRDRTVLYVHGREVLCGGKVFCPPRYSCVSLRQAVADDGWDSVADYLAEMQESLNRLFLLKGKDENITTVTLLDAAKLVGKTERHMRRLADEYGLWSDDGLVDLARLMAVRGSEEWHQRRRKRHPRTDPDGYLPPDDVNELEASGKQANIKRYADKARNGESLFPE